MRGFFNRILMSLFSISIVCILFKALGIDIWNIFFIPFFEELWKNIINLI